MRPFLIALALLAATPAAAETWRSREGNCGEWRGRWSVEQEQDGTWAGSIDFENGGGRCAAGTGQRVRTTVRAVIVGESFFAARDLEGTAVCTYYGRIEGDRVRGLELCEGVAGRMTFALRFPAADGDREARRRDEGREEDGYLDDPRTYERRGEERGLNFDRPSRR